MNKLLLSLLTLIFSFNLIQAQASKDAVFKYSNEKVKNERVESYSNSIKIGIVEPVWGYIPVFYKRKITDLFILEVGAGPTTRDFTYDIATRVYPRVVMINPYSSIEDTYFNTYRDYKYKLGYFFSFGPKFNVLKDGLNEYYLGLNFNIARHNMTSFDNYTQENSRDEHISYIGAALDMGYGFNKNNFSLDFGTQLGFKKMSYHRYIDLKENDGYSTVYTGYFDNENYRGVYVIYLRMGYAWKKKS